VTAAAELDAAPQGFSHEAFMYSSPAEFLDGTSSFVREGLEHDESVLVAVTGDRARWVREFFGSEPDVRLVDMAALGANPARIIPAWREFLDENAGRVVRGIGEPIWAGRTDAEMSECHQHESLLNLAFDGGTPWRLLCPCDVSALPGAVIDEARANHPVIVTGQDRSVSTTYHPDSPWRALRGEPLPPPDGPVTELAFTAGDLSSVRRLVGRHCEEVGLHRSAAEDLILSADEVASNSLLHGGGRGVLRVWVEGGELVCEISDDGTIRDPLAGREPPTPERTNGRGLWLANQLCDLVQVRSGAAGTVIRLHARIP
jgi:anti-sigma regulatory factor (Ser/Thr protein kinase)